MKKCVMFFGLVSTILFNYPMFIGMSERSKWVFTHNSDRHVREVLRSASQENKDEILRYAAQKRLADVMLAAINYGAMAHEADGTIFLAAARIANAELIYELAQRHALVDAQGLEAVLLIPVIGNSLAKNVVKRLSGPQQLAIVETALCCDKKILIEFLRDQGLLPKPDREAALLAHDCEMDAQEFMELKTQALAAALAKRGSNRVF